MFRTSLPRPRSNINIVLMAWRPMSKIRRLALMCMVLATAAVFFHLHKMQLKSSMSPTNTPELSPSNNLFRVATWNLRVPFPPDLEQNLSWIDRRHHIALAIAQWKPHILAVQEDCHFMNEYLMSTTTDWKEAIQHLQSIRSIQS